MTETAIADLLLECGRSGGAGSRPRPFLIGHRGAPRLAPENTLRSFELALDEGADSFEFDVVALSDGSLAVAHSRKQAERALAGRGGRDRRVELEQVLELAARRLEGRPFLADLKSSGLEPVLAETLRAYGLASQVLVCSLDRSSLRRLRSLAPEIPRSLSYPADRGQLSERRGFAAAVPAALRLMRELLPHRIGHWLDRTEASAVTLHHGVVSVEVVRACHARGVAVIAWTVNDESVASRLKAVGIDAIITDDPRLPVR